MAEFNPLRRVPEAAPVGYLYRRMFRLTGPLVRSTIWTVLSQLLPSKSILGRTVLEIARDRGDRAVEVSQQIYFDAPGLDSLTVRQATKVGVLIAGMGRTYVSLPAKTWPQGGTRSKLPAELLPRTGFDALMLAGLMIGNTLGYFKGGPVRSQLWWDSDRPHSQSLPQNHPEPAVRRFGVPRSLGDLAADIDDLYWAEAYGQCVKVTRVGEGNERRWLVSLPGTDHAEIRSQPNVADVEANMQEELGIASGMRMGVVQVIHEAMNTSGIDVADHEREKVLICGHSQGGIIAVTLAATDPEQLGFSVDAVITLGTPARRVVVRPEVTIVAVEHEQDVVPSLDGAPRKERDQRVVVRRRLNRPRRGPLFYAHSSSTYTTTLRHIEKEHGVVSWGRLQEALSVLQSYLPDSGERTRITHHYVWRDFTGEPHDHSWSTFLAAQKVDTKLITFDGEVSVPERRGPADFMQRVKKSIGHLTEGSSDE